MAISSQLIFLAIFGSISYFGLQEGGTINENAKKGLLAGIIVYIAHGFIRRFNGPYLRGNETLWRGSIRLVHIYLLAIIFILFQNTDDARDMMKFLHPSLGKKITKEFHTYEEQCELEWENILDNFDHYYLIHVINWFASALIITGVTLTRLLGWKQFDWFGRKNKKSFFSWEIFKCHRRFSAFLLIIGIIISNFLTGFLMINGLWIPPVMWMNPVRLLVWFLLANVAFGELYDDIETWNTPARKEEKISWEFRWLTIGVATIEVLISWKFRNGTGNLIDAPTPAYIWGPWAGFAALSLILYSFLRFKSNATTEFGERLPKIENKSKNEKTPKDQDKKVNQKPSKPQEQSKKGKSKTN